MRREVPAKDLEKRYQCTDLAKIGCGGCYGCSDCCCGMGESIVLDPWDIAQLCKATGQSFGELCQSCAELQVSDGVVLPNLRMIGPQEKCFFLNEQGRCSVHTCRPGICRLFPLGRIYENGSFSYFLQSGECPKEPKTKVKIEKWLEIPHLKRYEQYILEWHELLEEMRDVGMQKLTEGFDCTKSDEDSGEEIYRFSTREYRELNTYLLNVFYAEAYSEADDWYVQFEERKERFRKTAVICKVFPQEGQAGI